MPSEEKLLVFGPNSQGFSVYEGTTDANNPAKVRFVHCKDLKFPPQLHVARAPLDPQICWSPGANELYLAWGVDYSLSTGPEHKTCLALYSVGQYLQSASLEYLEDNRPQSNPRSEDFSSLLALRNSIHFTFLQERNNSNVEYSLLRKSTSKASSQSTSWALHCGQENGWRCGQTLFYPANTGESNFKYVYILQMKEARRAFHPNRIVYLQSINLESFEQITLDEPRKRIWDHFEIGNESYKPGRDDPYTSLSIGPQAVVLFDRGKKQHWMYIFHPLDNNKGLYYFRIPIRQDGSLRGGPLLKPEDASQVDVLRFFGYVPDRINVLNFGDRVWLFEKNGKSISCPISSDAVLLSENWVANPEILPQQGFESWCPVTVPEWFLDG